MQLKGSYAIKRGLVLVTGPSAPLLGPAASPYGAIGSPYEFLGEAFLLTVGAFLLTVELLRLQSRKALMRGTFPL